MKNLTLVFLCCLCFGACQKPKEENIEKTISTGKIKIAIDDALRPIIEAQIGAYQIPYPEAQFERIYTNEQKAISLLLHDSVAVAVTTRGFDDNELAYIKSRDMDYQPARMALDGLTIITNKNSGDTTMTLAELKAIVSDKNNKTKLVFDNGSGSNYDLLLQRLNLKTIDKEKAFSAHSNMEVFETIQKTPGAIGFVSYNYISDTDDKKMMALRNTVNVMAVADQEGFYKPNFKNIKARKYPLERIIYLHTLDTEWGIAKGFIRFACSKVGQLVAEKMGLVPFYIIPKAYILNNEPADTK